jgi:hypothetical protein
MTFTSPKNKVHTTNHNTKFRRFTNKILTNKVHFLIYLSSNLIAFSRATQIPPLYIHLGLHGVRQLQA